MPQLNKGFWIYIHNARIIQIQGYKENEVLLTHFHLYEIHYFQSDIEKLYFQENS